VGYRVNHKGAFRIADLPNWFRWNASNHGVGWNVRVLADQGSGSDHASVPYFGATQNRGPHSNQNAVPHLHSMHNGTMPNRAIRTNLLGGTRITMHDGTILNIGSRSNLDWSVIPSHHSTKPNGAIFTELDVASDNGSTCDHRTAWHTAHEPFGRSRENFVGHY